MLTVEGSTAYRKQTYNGTSKSRVPRQYEQNTAICDLSPAPEEARLPQTHSWLVKGVRRAEKRVPHHRMSRTSHKPDQDGQALTIEQAHTEQRNTYDQRCAYD